MAAGYKRPFTQSPYRGKRVWPLGPPPIAWLSAQARRRTLPSYNCIRDTRYVSYWLLQLEHFPHALHKAVAVRDFLFCLPRTLKLERRILYMRRRRCGFINIARIKRGGHAKSGGNGAENRRSWSRTPAARGNAKCVAAPREVYDSTPFSHLVQRRRSRDRNAHVVEIGRIFLRQSRRGDERLGTVRSADWGQTAHKSRAQIVRLSAGRLLTRAQNRVQP